MTGVQTCALPISTQIKVKEVVAYEVMPDTILDLQAGRIHAAVNDRPFLAYITKGKTDVYLLPDVAFGDNIFIGIAFHPEDDELREKVNEAIKAIVADGTYSKIYEKWFGRKPSAADMPF